MKPVLVAGPHRSGTSMTTRVVSLLGPTLCAVDDRMTQWDNPLGHWESASLTTFNDELLAALGGTWYAPPELLPSWEEGPDLEAWRPRAIEQFRRVHPASDWVWKDPRLCLLLPFWTSVLETDPVLVLTVRHPVETARSLVARDAWGLAHAIAIWEHSVTSLLRAARGLPVILVRFDELLGNTRREVSRLRDALDAFGVHLTKNDIEAAVGSVDPSSRHYEEGAARSLLTASQAELYRLQLSLDGSYERFPAVATPAAEEASIELLAARRRIHGLEQEVEERNTWAFRLSKEIAEHKTTIGRLHSDLEQQARWSPQRDQPTGPYPTSLETFTCATRADLAALQKSELFRRRYALETFIAWRHQPSGEVDLPGFCLLDACPVNFKLDWLYSQPPMTIDWLSSDGQAVEVCLPNWRERLICPRCGLNNRQRAIAAKALESIHRQRAVLGRTLQVCLTEQATPEQATLEQATLEQPSVLARFFAGRALDADILESEFVDREALSFDNACMDLVVSNSLLTRTQEPLEAVVEMARILRPEGELFLETPFDSWDLIEQVQATGLLTCGMVIYWSLEFGHLGGTQFFFHARRTTAPWTARG